MASDLINTQDAPIWIAGAATDMRLGLPGLAKKIETEMGRDPKKRGIFVFVSKDFRRAKILWWDRNGFAMLYKHCEKKVFRVERRSGYAKITAVKVRALFAGRVTKKIEKKEAR